MEVSGFIIIIKDKSTQFLLILSGVLILPTAWWACVCGVTVGGSSRGLSLGQQFLI